ncbi:YceI family protein [Winogradskyella eckloniae]|nr:YceI family protein [Winogradskyella eckloniae]
MVRTLLFLVFFFICALETEYKKEDATTKELTVVLATDSFLKINGKTNVSTFECEFNMSAISKSIAITYVDFENNIEFDDAKLILPNVEFDCGGKAINKDFKALLKTEEFPEITLKLIELSKVKTSSNSRTATIEISISNVVKTYNIPVSIVNNDILHVNGVMPLDITDFNLVAPAKMLGMVKVSPLIEIEFSLKIKAS